VRLTVHSFFIDCWVYLYAQIILHEPDNVPLTQPHSQVILPLPDDVPLTPPHVHQSGELPRSPLDQRQQNILNERKKARICLTGQAERMVKRSRLNFFVCINLTNSQNIEEPRQRGF